MLSWILLAEGGQPIWANPLVPVIFIGVMFYFIVARHDRKRRAEMAALLANLKKNDRVLTVGGIIGTVVSTDKKDYVTLRVDESNNTRITLQRSAITRVVSDEPSEKTAE